jgi:hypothetical protein
MVFSEGPTVIIDTTTAVAINATRGTRADKADDAAVMAAADRCVHALFDRPGVSGLPAVEHVDL